MICLFKQRLAHTRLYIPYTQRSMQQNEDGMHPQLPAKKKARHGERANTITVVSKTKKIPPPIPGQVIFDVSSKGTEYVKLSPFFPHKDKEGKMPVLQVPCMPPGTLTMSVEGAWQGLKIFDAQGMDLKNFVNDKMKKLKRGASKKRGNVCGHCIEDESGERVILGYVDARKRIYIPLYNQMLDLPEIQPLLEKLYNAFLTSDIVLLDYTTNCDVEDTKTALSHAGLIKARLHQMFEERNSAPSLG